MRAALVRYAQPQPQRVNDLLDVVRRAQWALGQHTTALQRDGVALWEALDSDSVPSDKEQAKLVALLRVVVELDRIGDVLAHWAVDISGDSPDAAVDAAAAEAGEGLDALGVPHEERPPPRQRG